MIGVFYRSDTRTPFEPDHIFRDGFSKSGSPLGSLRLRFPRGEGSAPDVDSDTAVSITRHFEAAAIFPVDDDKISSWIYIISTNTESLFNIHEMQWNHIVERDLAGLEDAFWPMYGQERAMDIICPQSIVGAVLVDRNILDYREFGFFKCRQYIPSPRFEGLREIAQLAQELIRPIIAADEWLRTPTQRSGFQRSSAS